MATNSPFQTEARQKGIQSFAFVISAVVCVLFCSCFLVSHLLVPGQSHEIELDEKVNPNDAPLGSLVRLPGIGTGKAGAIVAYRNNFSDSNSPAFETTDDLERVSGIGPKTMKDISEWLRFE
jgi:competence ComEA-like helix-hairpin-helix protein